MPPIEFGGYISVPDAGLFEPRPSPERGGGLPASLRDLMGGGHTLRGDTPGR